MAARFRSVLLTLACFGILTFPAVARNAQEVNIPAGDLVAAVQEYVRQTGVELVYRPEHLQGLKTHGVRGTVTPEHALNQLIRGTSLVLSGEPGGVFLIAVPEKEGVGDDAPMEGGGGNSGDEALRLDVAPERSDVASAEVASLDTISVTGTRIRRAEDMVAPTAIFSRDDIERTGAATVQDLFDSLPQNFAEIGVDGVYGRDGGSATAQTNNMGRVSGVDLRGLGPQSTLTLVNGQRRAGSLEGRIVDLSAIPLSVVEQVDVLSGGRSAIYGSDAVAGVVNIVTRRDFRGSESQVHYGSPTDYGGGDRMQASHITGFDSERGTLVAAYDYMQTRSLNILDTGLVAPVHPITGATRLRRDGQSDLSRHAVFLAGRHDLSDRVELHADGMYTTRDIETLDGVRMPGANEDTVTRNGSSSDHLSLALGVNVDLGDTWRLLVDGGLSGVRDRGAVTSVYDSGDMQMRFRATQDDEMVMATVSAVADGRIRLGNGFDPHVAVGLELRDEDYERGVGQFGPDDALADFARDGSGRRVKSAFAEVLIPLLEGARGSGPAALELSLAGRYDHYSDFGSTFNPHGGLNWRPTAGVSVRGTYSTAFRAPGLADISGRNFAAIVDVPDPKAGGTRPLLVRLGNNPQLGAEEATTWSLGIDYEPAFAPFWRASLSYFNVRYRDRLDTPLSTLLTSALEREGEFPGLVDRAPDAAELEAILSGLIDPVSNSTATPFDPTTQNILDVFPRLAVFDNRTQNIAAEDFRGLDLQIRMHRDLEAGSVSAGLNGTYTLKHERRLSELSDAASRINEVGKPVGFRVRADAGWQRGRYSVFVYANHADSYRNPYSIPPSGMSSWTTFDLTLRFDDMWPRDTGIPHGWSAALSVENVFDRAPPEFVGSIEGMRYDVSNASPIGRYASLRLVRRW